MGRHTGRLEGKVAIITGAGSGIGWAAASRFADEGARVVCADISGQEREIAERLGDIAMPVRVDVTNAADVQRMVTATVDRFGQVDVLLNNAGFGGPHVALADTDESLFEGILAINLKGVFLGMKYAIPRDARRRWRRNRQHRLGVRAGRLEGFVVLRRGQSRGGADDEIRGAGLCHNEHPHQRDLPWHDLHRPGRGQTRRRGAVG
jgi:NAD(P)-dependent dehydrogenase (short-subunit alcohol dehydrogenase family)